MSKTSSDATSLKHLGSGSSDFGNFKPADSDLLERFRNPMNLLANGLPVIQLGGYEDPKEFTSLCPKTGQPDFARIVVEYVPLSWCVESKSWKLYLASFRNHQDFHEACVARILGDLVTLLDPQWMRVTGEFTPRGGISINPSMEYQRGSDAHMPEPH